MSRIGKMPVKIPSGVTVDIADGKITVNGGKGSLTQFTMPEVRISKEDDQLVFSAVDDERFPAPSTVLCVRWSKIW